MGAESKILLAVRAKNSNIGPDSTLLENRGLNSLLAGGGRVGHEGNRVDQPTLESPKSGRGALLPKWTALARRENEI